MVSLCLSVEMHQASVVSTVLFTVSLNVITQFFIRGRVK